MNPGSIGRTNNAQLNQAQGTGEVQQTGNLGGREVQAAPAQPRGGVAGRIFSTIAGFFKAVGNLFGGNRREAAAAPAQPREAAAAVPAQPLKLTAELKGQLKALQDGKTNDMKLISAWASGDREKTLRLMKEQLSLSEHDVESIRNASGPEARKNGSSAAKLPHLGQPVTMISLAPYDILTDFTKKAGQMTSGLTGKKELSNPSQTMAELTQELSKLKGNIYRDVLEDCMPNARFRSLGSIMEDNLGNTWNKLDAAINKAGE